MSNWDDVKVGDKIKFVKYSFNNSHMGELAAKILAAEYVIVREVHDGNATGLTFEFGVASYGAWVTDGDLFEILPEKVSEKIPTGVVGEVTGGSSPSYYRKAIRLPTTADRKTFVEVDLECTDIIRILDLTFDRANIFKSGWRNDAKEGVSEKYSSDKILWSELQHRLKQGFITDEQFWEQSELLGLSKD